MPFLSMFMKAIGLLSLGSVFAFVTTWGTIFRMCPIGSSGCAQTVGNQVAIKPDDLRRYGPRSNLSAAGSSM